jgi:hypothetical protein
MQRIPIFLENKQFDNIANKIYETYPKACILFIDLIDNPQLKKVYNDYKEKLIEKRGSVKELDLFHGTHANLIDIIAEEGFDPAKNVVSAYGKGSYFSSTAAYSFNYMKSSDKEGISYMFLAKVLQGKIGEDISIAGNIHVMPVWEGAYPEYVIAFYKNAQ